MHDTLALMRVSYHRSVCLSIPKIVFPLYSLFFLPPDPLTTLPLNVTIPPNKAKASCNRMPYLFLFHMIHNSVHSIFNCEL